MPGRLTKVTFKASRSIHAQCRKGLMLGVKPKEVFAGLLANFFTGKARVVDHWGVLFETLAILVLHNKTCSRILFRFKAKLSAAFTQCVRRFGA